MRISHRFRTSLLASLPFLAFLVTPAAGAVGLSQLQGGTLRVGYFTDTPGLVQQGGGQVTGFAPEVLALVARELKVKNVTWRKLSSQEALLRELSAGTLDAAFDVKLPQILADAEQLAPVVCTGGVMFARPGGPKTEADLRSAKIAMATDHPYFNYVRNLPFPKTVVAFENADKALLAFLGGSADVLLLDRFDALKMYTRLGPEKLQVSPLLWSQPVALVVKVGSDKQVGAAVGAALQKVQASGNYAKLSKKYFTQDVRCAG
ncbi:substrate-binding periplasmic protein [Deinococcus hopiensis]|uniref:Polar amino acid transport system substrate-binding protein n=1 Tax=Deinococcus hopiensis KR-140 TaxID=695939 RepID=A0A1W1UFR0_9DEIO|nr:ABC transporter substrate-binding protein [Deinococcus hopiensis]SMB79916.1 polar amino acid transport system substrate-binding protein [Deinococcus hopiensis KR-140]